MLEQQALEVLKGLCQLVELPFDAATEPVSLGFVINKDYSVKIFLKEDRFIISGDCCVAPKKQSEPLALEALRLNLQLAALAAPHLIYQSEGGAFQLCDSIALGDATPERLKEFAERLVGFAMRVRPMLVECSEQSQSQDPPVPPAGTRRFISPS